jgi:hypothetical protein
MTKYQAYLWNPFLRKYVTHGEHETPEQAIERCKLELSRCRKAEGLFATVLVQPSTVVWDSRKDS